MGGFSSQEGEVMLDLKSIESRMTEERIKAELTAAQAECDCIIGRFDHLDRLPTAEEREARLSDFLKSRKRLGELRNRLLELRCPLN
jgi:hypothetical protein